MANILVLDDDNTFLELTSRFLRKMGHHPYLLDNSESLFQYLAKKNLDALILDIKMPGRHGLELLQDIKSRPNYRILPVIMVTGSTDVRFLEQCLAWGAIDFISKPFSQAVLQARLNSALKTKFYQESWIKEYRKLKAEILIREQIEEELKHSQSQWLHLLDLMEEGIIFADKSQEILFINTQAEYLLGYPTKKILGRPLRDFVMMEEDQSFDKLIPVDSLKMTAKCKDPTSVPIQILWVKTLSDKSSIWTLTSKESPTLPLSDPHAFHFGVPTELTKDLERKHQKIQAFEAAFGKFFQRVHNGEMASVPEIKNMSKMFERTLEFLPTDDQNQDLRKELVTVMNLSLECWEQATETTKIELAEESGIWRASLDRGNYRTKTLDRYLNLDSLPKNPRWKDIVDTARFVLKHCPDPTPWHSRLESALQRLQVLLHRIHC